MGAKYRVKPLRGFARAGLFMLPGARRLPVYELATQDDFATISDAVRACRASGLQGWDLVAKCEEW